MVSNTQLFQTYLQHYANKDLEAISAMFAPDIHLRDWNVLVYGKEAVVHETAKNFADAESIAIEIKAMYQNTHTVAGELRIVVNQNIELFVVDVLEFDAEGQIKAIRSYKGRGD